MIVDAFTCERIWVVSQISRLEQELFGQGAWSRKTVEQELQAPARTYFLDVAPGCASSTQPYLDSEELRGYAGFWFDGDDCEIMTIGVARNHQHLGIGSGLLRRMIESSCAQGARRVLLEVQVDNTSALGLYEHFGFRKLGLRRRYYQPQGADAFTMALDLKPIRVGFIPHDMSVSRREQQNDNAESQATEEDK
ncbi:ribosomal protein S18-alanine N-acetyltransferase [Bifidobacterium bombi]|uniref:Ribosomal-protein-alanine N-acetyltransferase n=1 Tax=Bifidobacterium bombi DSM 19703 TaxID=1341695 RepID=A0A080N471_9BIFI|nr:ribosomal protein S18-alanine N-acetyltransferase [Bifidobacterium bombi]KFF31095.1 ribosomal-protein-alanine N-acetyltransferase [Bifidobacterium bombi DSM 19703]